MTIAIIICPDKAGQNIKQYLADLPSNAFIYEADEKCVYCEDIDKKAKADLFIFATTHRSESGKPSLSVHTQGNWGKAELGGKDKELAVAPALYLKEALKKLVELNDIGFDSIQECTHHGPYLEKPCLFIEIGSSEKEWVMKKPARIIAAVVKHLCSVEPKEYKTAVGIGGIHHTPNFKKIQLGDSVAVGHVCPKYMLEQLDAEMLKQAIDKTEPKAEMIIIDWKGLGQYKDKVKKLAEESGLEVKRTNEF